MRLLILLYQFLLCQAIQNRIDDRRDIRVIAEIISNNKKHLSYFGGCLRAFGLLQNSLYARCKSAMLIQCQICKKRFRLFVRKSRKTVKALSYPMDFLVKFSALLNKTLQFLLSLFDGVCVGVCHE
jgi:hypothetical protein